MFQAVFMCFSLYLGIGCGPGGMSPQGLLPNLLMQFFTVASSKIEVFERFFFNTVITYNYHPRYVTHVLAQIYVVFTLFWVCVAWGDSL